MAERIKGITIEIDGNTKKLNDALKETNKEIKSTQYALRDVEKLLKMDPGNIELLKQKQELLGKAVDETKSKLDLLKKAQADMDAQGIDKSSEAYQKLERQIISTEKALQSAEKASKSFNANLEAVSQKAGKVASATKGLSMAAGGALAGLAGLGVKAAKDADELNTLSKQTGLSTDALQKMQYASELVDVDVNTITGAVSKMKKGLDSNADAFEKIGVSVKDANGEYRDTESIFYDTIQALGQIQNETERDIVAMDLFGKSADELAGIIDDGGKAMRELGKEAESKGLIISQDDLDKANDLNDTLDKLKTTVGSSVGKAAVSVAEALAPVLETIAGVIEKVAGAITKLSPTAVKILSTILLVVAAISPVATIIAKVATLIQTLTPIIATLNAVMAANPIGVIILAIAGLVAAFVLLWNNCEGFRNFFIEMWEGIKSFFSGIADWFGGVFEKIGGFFKGIGEKAGEVKDSISEKWNTLKDNTAQAWELIKGKTSEVWGAIKGKIEENGGGIEGYLKTVAQGYQAIWEGAFNKINELTGGKLGEALEKVREKLSRIKEVFEEKIEAAKTWGRDMIQNFIDGIKEKFTAFKDTIVSLAQTVKDFIGFSVPDKGPLSKANTFMPDMIDLLGKTIDENLNKLNGPMTNLANTLKPETNVNVNMNDSAVTSRLDKIGETLGREQTPVPVVLNLSPNAKGLFNVVREQNQMFMKSTGMSGF